MQMMVRFFLSMLLVVAISGCSEQEQRKPVSVESPTVSQEEHASELVFEPPVVDLGTLKEGDDVVAYLRVRNAGNSMQQIADLQASCGCTEVKPEESLLMPGGFTRISVKVDTFAKQDAIKKWVLLTDGEGKTSKAWINFTVRPNPHMGDTTRSIFDGKCAACHFEPAEHKVAGRDIYAAVCAMCHGEKASGGVAPALTGIGDVNVLSTLIAHGTGSQHMPGFAKKEGGPLSEKQISALSRWLSKLDE